MAHIHHVQIFVKNGTKYLQKFTRNVNFRLFATRKTATLRQWAVQSGSVVFVITDMVDNPLTKDSLAASGDNAGIGQETEATSRRGLKTPEPVHLSEIPDACFLEPSMLLELDAPETSRAECPRNEHRDTVFNIAFEVGDVAETSARVASNGAKVLCRPTVVSDATNDGHVTVAAVQSCIGNVVHTLIDISNYSGVFLPGFITAGDRCDLAGISVEENSQETCNTPSVDGGLPVCLTSHIDHVTFACPIGSSSEVWEWYENCFGMKRFLLIEEESESEGFIVRGKNVGLRIKAMEYWHCAEIGLTLPVGQEKEEDAGKPRPPNPKFVIAEALPGQGPNQVDRFLEQHGGAGIQHIGLHTPNILQAVGSLRRAGLAFIDPPPAYYTQVGKLTEISRIRDDVDLLQRMGILLDEETCCHDDDKGNPEIGDKIQNKKTHKYLMQTFTKPIFEQDTFFLEIIQRHGATGFGAGNIRALWRAVEAYMSVNRVM